MDSRHFINNVWFTQYGPVWRHITDIVYGRCTCTDIPHTIQHVWLALTTPGLIATVFDNNGCIRDSFMYIHIHMHTYSCIHYILHIHNVTHTHIQACSVSDRGYMPPNPAAMFTYSIPYLYFTTEFVIESKTCRRLNPCFLFTLVASYN